MARIAPDTCVRMKAAAMRMLRFPPPSPDLVIAAHAAALRAPDNALTLTVHVTRGTVTWVGAVDEGMLEVSDGGAVPGARGLIARSLATGAHLWHCVTPGPLLAARSPAPTTVYAGSRPWLVVGRLDTGAVLAAPVNDARGQEKWYAPHLPPGAVPTPEAKESQIELAHLWSLPVGSRDIGVVAAGEQARLREALLTYYR